MLGVDGILVDFFRDRVEPGGLVGDEGDRKT